MELILSFSFWWSITNSSATDALIDIAESDMRNLWIKIVILTMVVLWQEWGETAHLEYSKGMLNCQFSVNFGHFDGLTKLVDGFLCKQQENNWLNMERARGEVYKTCPNVIAFLACDSWWEIPSLMPSNKTIVALPAEQVGAWGSLGGRGLDVLMLTSCMALSRGFKYILLYKEIRWTYLAAQVRWMPLVVFREWDWHQVNPNSRSN